MPTLNIGGQKVSVGDEFLKLSPDQQNATVDEIAKSLPTVVQPAAPQRSAVGDFFKSIPRGVLSGLSSAGSALGQATMHEMGQPQGAAEIPSGEQTTGILEKNVTGELPKPEGRVGRFGAAIGESIGNPASYVGPGSLPLKVGGAILSAAGSEGAGQATKGTKFEGPSRFGGALLGGMTAAKAFGPTVERAAIPTAQELKDAAARGYDAARNSGLVLDPRGVGSWASTVEQELSGPKFGFSGGNRGTSPKTMGVLDDLQSAPPGSTVSASNLDSLRKNLGNIAKETQLANGGAVKPTADAAAASVALERLNAYTENIPQNHILAGDAANYVRATKEANANYAAGSRVQDFDARLNKAERATDRQVAGSLDSQIKSKAGQMLDNSQRTRGMNEAEKAQLELINDGTLTSNVLRQLGRGGAGVIPIGAHVLTAAATGGASIPASLAIAAPLYAARKISEGMTKSRAEALAEMLAKRSPEYERRANLVPPPDVSPGVATVMRALIAH